MSSGAPGAWDSDYHAPVLVAEILEALGNSSEILDCTLGGGGHSEALLSEGKSVTGIDRDPVALEEAKKRLASYLDAGRFRAIQGNFAYIDEMPAIADLQFDGILADLGVSSRQINDQERGFSFREGAQLDMRMEGSGESAADYLNSVAVEDLSAVLRDYGDEPKARRMAAEIVRRRGNREFRTSDDLVGAIRAVLGARSGPGDFARIFQAVRIAVNDEIRALELALPALRDKLTPGGTIAIISYHSGEDRVVKNGFREWSRSCVCPPEQLQCNCRGRALGRVLTKKAISASDAEVARNSRARSARLRVWRSAAQ
ncbi:MAG: 16S rRNA (cytosine(1402)-N(4))-methyltransferase RsmH [Gemmatimonadaceae bacterium]|nr:16S rRNA (cytosine(1402)-N(4))-methyltransferase RsmH [Gemmatimonadaceae bacterium]